MKSWVSIYIYMALVHRGVIDQKCIKSKHFFIKKTFDQWHWYWQKYTPCQPGRKLLPCSTQYKTVNLQNTSIKLTVLNCAVNIYFHSIIL